MDSYYKAQELIDIFKTKSSVLYSEDSIPNILTATKTKNAAIEDAILHVNELIKIIHDCKCTIYSITYLTDVINQLKRLKTNGR